MIDNRIDWHALREQINLPALATALLGPPVKRSGRRLLWSCPFHDDHDPSFEVDSARRRWKCWPCNLGGDAVALVMKRQGVTFPEAARIAAELAGVLVPAGKRRPARPRPPKPPGPAAAVKPAKAPAAAPKESTGLPLAEAVALVEAAAKRLWIPEGADALDYLRGRGLNDDTIGPARLGWTPPVAIPIRDETRYWSVVGITIPWFDANRLALVKIRRPKGSEPRYAQAFGDSPRIYPGPEVIQPGARLIITEGEFDALLLGQELVELAAVVTLGSTSSTRPDWMMPAAAEWYLAIDADDAGNKAASEWPDRV
jgi:DNA primase